MTLHAVPHDVSRCLYDNLVGETTTLRNCSLVCRSWTYPTASYLFHRISLREPATEGEDPCETLLGVIAASRRMQYGIVELNLDGDNTYPGEDRCRFFKQRSLAANALHRLISHLPHLQAVQMHAFDIVGQLSLDIPKTKIPYLTIWDDPLRTMSSEATLAQTLSLFGECDTLCIRLKFSSFVHPVTVEQRTISRLRVKHLDLDLCTAAIPGVARVLKALLDFSVLETIDATGSVELVDTVFLYASEASSGSKFESKLPPWC